MGWNEAANKAVDDVLRLAQNGGTEEEATQAVHAAAAGLSLQELQDAKASLEADIAKGNARLN